MNPITSPLSLDRLRRVRWLRRAWEWGSVPGSLATWFFRWTSRPTDWTRIWYCLAFSALRGSFPVPVARRLLDALGPVPGPEALRPQASRPPLWWALASNGATACGQRVSDIEPLLNWWKSQALNLSGRFLGYDFLIASLRAGNRQAFAWGLSQGLPPDGCELPDPDEPRFVRADPIESDLRTPLWHAVESSTLADSWWIDQLIAAGARWDYAGGGISAAELDRELAIGWSAWWKKKKLLDHLAPRDSQEPQRKM